MSFVTPPDAYSHRFGLASRHTKSLFPRVCGTISYSSVTDDLLMTSMIGEGTNKQAETPTASIRLRYLSIFNRVAARLNRSPLQRFLFAILCLSVFLHLSEKNLRNSCHLPEEAYFSSTILFGGLTSSLAFVGTFLCAVLGAILYRKRRWSDCNSHRSFRFLIIASAATLTWAASTYSFNYYFDQAHNFDRISIALLCLGLMRWPSLVGLFVVYAFAILSQFDQPFGGFSWTDKDLPLRVMLLFGASLWLSITARRRELMRVSLLMTFSLIASHYFVHQHYHDVYRKCYLQAHKHADFLDFPKRMWQELAWSQPDFAVASLALADGLSAAHPPTISKLFLPAEMIKSRLQTLSLPDQESNPPQRVSASDIRSTALQSLPSNLQREHSDFVTRMNRLFQERPRSWLRRAFNRITEMAA